MEPSSSSKSNFYRADLSHIPVDFVAPPSSFGEDFQVHRSVPGIGGVETLVAPPLLASNKQPYGGPQHYRAGPSDIMFTDTTVKTPTVDASAAIAAVAKDSSLNSDDSSVTELPELPDVPFFLEPTTHVYVMGRLPSGGSSLDSVVQIVENVFSACQVDYVFKPHKCKWKAQRCQQYTKVDFRTRFFRCDGGDIVVEFQKRKGDYFLMRETFEKLLSALEARKLVRELAPCFSAPSCLGSFGRELSKPCSPFAMGEGIYLPPPVFSRDSTSYSTSSLLGSDAEVGSSGSLSPGGDAGEGSGSSSSSADLVAPLVRMAKADCHLVNFEAANAIASLSASEDNRAMLKEAGAVPALLSLVQRTPCKDVEQAVVTALSNLSESACCKSHIVEAGACRDLLRLLVRGLDASSSSSNNSVHYCELETRRECLRTLANLSEEHASAMLKCMGKDALMSCIKKLEGVRDERLRMHSRRLRNRIRCAC